MNDTISVEDNQDDHKTTQKNLDGEEIEIKDPIYDIMSDKEEKEGFERLMSLADEKRDDEE